MPVVTLRTVAVQHWTGFPDALRTIAKFRSEVQESIQRTLSEPLFRGIGNHEWELETTLERSPDVPVTQTLTSYYERAERSKPAIESLTGKEWDEIPSWPDLKADLQDITSGIDRVFARHQAIYRYLVYLRHHGFPSPLLDWTISPFIAAAFAFDAIDRKASHVGIYALFRDPLRVTGHPDGDLIVVGPYLRTHSRHYRQQSRYSLLLARRSEQAHGGKVSYDYGFVKHHQWFEKSVDKSLLVLIQVPASDYRSALMELDSMNLNPYSLYGSEESLIRTIARREFLF